MHTEPDIIDAEVVSETTHEAESEASPKKVDSDHSRQVNFYGTLSLHLFRFGRSFFLLFAAMGLIFSILHSQNDGIAFLILMIVAWSLTGLAFLAGLFGFVFQRIMRSHMEKDPNYEQYL